MHGQHGHSCVIISQKTIVLVSPQTQTEELKVAKGLAEEGAKERLQWVEVEKENSRLKTKMASLPVLQKENQRMKKELDSLPALQKELETLRATVTELKRSAGTKGSVEPGVRVVYSSEVAHFSVFLSSEVKSHSGSEFDSCNDLSSSLQHRTSSLSKTLQRHPLDR